MLDKRFLEKQNSQRIRDILNYYDGYFSSFEGLEPYLETNHGKIEGKKINYKTVTTIFAINIRRKKDLPFRADVQDPDRILKSERVHESRKQHSSKGYRYFEFGDDDKDVEFAKEQFTKVINFHLQSYLNG